METLSIATVQGQPVTQLPKDLYIPPDALEVLLETFEGPLDLLLYLIRKQNLAIVEISLAEVTRQFMDYIEIMQALRLDLAAEYLVMAAVLAEIKSRALLPQPSLVEGEEQDPRLDLMQRLQQYERYKQAAESLEGLPQLGRDCFVIQPVIPPFKVAKTYPPVALDDLLHALRDVLLRAERFAHHQIKREALSVRERMTQVLVQLEAGNFMEFSDLFPLKEGRQGVVVTFLAVLELIKAALIELVQVEPFSPIHVKLATVDGGVMAHEGG